MMKVTPIATPKITPFDTTLVVIKFVATTHADQERGPKIWLRRHDADIRGITAGEVVVVNTPRRPELAELGIDDGIPDSCAIARDIPGIAPSERVTVVRRSDERESTR